MQGSFLTAKHTDNYDYLDKIKAYSMYSYFLWTSKYKCLYYRVFQIFWNKIILHKSSTTNDRLMKIIFIENLTAIIFASETN